jgi:hypothetical protein
MLWMGGVAIGQIESLLMQHLPGNDAAGSARSAADRTQSLIGAIVEIARCLHPTADLDQLAQLLPVQLEIGVPADLVPLALHADGRLGRPDYLRLYRQALTDPAAILAASDDALLECLGGSTSRLRHLRRAAQAALDDANPVSFSGVLPTATD